MIFDRRANMSDTPLVGRPEDEPRLDVHNSNVDHQMADSGQCGTLDLRTGRVCRRPALHTGGCEFQAPNNGE